MNKIFKAIIFFTIVSIYFSCGAQISSPAVDVLFNEELFIKQILPNLLSGKNVEKDFFDSARELANLKLVCRTFNKMIAIESMDAILRQAGIKPDQVPVVYLFVEYLNGSKCFALRALIKDRMDTISRERNEQITNGLSGYSIYVNCVAFSFILLVLIAESIF